MSSLTTFYVSNVNRSVPGTALYTVVVDAAADGSGGKIPMGSVIVRRETRTHLTVSGETMQSPLIIAQLDAALDHYLEWAARHG
jgi:hypothetical protein